MIFGFPLDMLIMLTLMILALPLAFGLDWYNQRKEQPVVQSPEREGDGPRGG